MHAGVARQRHHVVAVPAEDRKSTRLNSSHLGISYAVFCLKKKKTIDVPPRGSTARDLHYLHVFHDLEAEAAGGSRGTTSAAARQASRREAKQDGRMESIRQ